jgi:hypothetical protein
MRTMEVNAIYLFQLLSSPILIECIVGATSVIAAPRSPSYFEESNCTPGHRISGIGEGTLMPQKYGPFFFNGMAT